MKCLRVIAVALAVSLVAAACTHVAVEEPLEGAHAPTVELALSEPPASSTTTLPSESSLDEEFGVATWPLVDTVPAFRKAGVLVVSGVDYEPELDDGLRQRAAILTLATEAGVFALAPERGDVSYDQIQLGMDEASVMSWPFVITADGVLVVFAAAGELGHCEIAIATDQPFSAFGVEGDVDGNLAFGESRCTPATTEGEMIIGNFPTPASGVRSFGVLLSGSSQSEIEISIGWLALGLSTITEPPPQLRITLAGQDHSLSARSADRQDDAALNTLHVLRDDGSTMSIQADAESVFLIDRVTLGARAKLWVDDYGLEHYVQQGPWIDPTRISADLVIDMTPKFVETGEPPAPSDSHQRPHATRIWNGSAGLDQQQFHGVNWTNNLGFTDRDRDPDNPNGCLRSAWLGGSYVIAGETRVDQKPALIAEALLDAGAEQCHEILSVGVPLYTVENHLGNAVSLVEEFGVTRLIFSISGNELCRMHDEVYASVHGVAPDTPVHWRFRGGVAIPPLSRGDAIEYEPADEFESSAVCSFNPDRSGFDAAHGIINKLLAIGTYLESLLPGVEVTFYIMKDPLGGRAEMTETILMMCRAGDHDCHAMPIPPAFRKPDDLIKIDYNPSLLRFVGDGHPNARANQFIGRGLADVISGRGE
jgi:hypothetical protein